MRRRPTAARRHRDALPARALALLAPLALAACEIQESVTAEPRDLVIVEAYLRAGADQQWVFLHRTLGTDTTRAVPGAEIVVRGSGGGQLGFFRTDVQECVDSAGAPPTIGACYAASGRGALHSFVQPGVRYTLEVRLKDGRILGGTTTVPAAFRLVRPSVDGRCTLPPDRTLELVWTRAEGAWAYVAETKLFGLQEALARHGLEMPDGPIVLQGLSVSAADTSIVFPTEFGVFDRFASDSEFLRLLQDGLPAGVRGEIVVAAVDRNFVNWARGGNFNPSGLVRVPSVRGAGGTGVFGSLVTRSFLFQVEHETEVQPCL